MRTLARSLLVALVVGGVPILLEFVGAGAWIVACSHIGGASAVVAAGALLAALVSRWRHDALRLVVLAAAVAVACFGSLQFQGMARRAAFVRTAERSTGLVNAITAFERATGRPPASLDDLVPTYIGQVPSTGLLMHRDYRYRRLAGERMLYWYDLGSRNGRPTRGPSKYPDGPPGNAIVVVFTDADGEVLSVDVDRLPAEPHTMSTNPTRSAAPTGRAYPGLDAAQRRALVGKSLREVRRRLGNPQGSRGLSTAPWELRIDCGRGFLNWDVFFYWPTRSYPAHIYDGNVERIRDWAYVHG